MVNLDIQGRTTQKYTTLRSTSKMVVASLLYAFSLSPVLAQPVPMGAISYAVVGNQFIIHGGAILNDVLNQQFWALNLSASWQTTSPAWIQLPNGPYNAYHTAVASGDNKTFITFGRDTGAVASMIPQHWVNIYDFTTSAWTGFSPTGVQDLSRRDFQAVLNPKLQVVYIAGGDAGTGGDIQSNMFDVYDIAKKEIVETTIPASGPRGPYTYGAAWLQNHNSMLMVGGQLAPSGYTTAAYRYDATSNTWSTQRTTGDFAFNRISPCVASSTDGTKYVVYGGYVNGAPGGAADPAVYVLDTTTWVWTKYAQNGQGRGNAACALVDNMFIVWGGYYNINHDSNTATPTVGDALVLFDIAAGKWLTNYTPPAWLTSVSPPGDKPQPPNPETGGKGTGLSTGAIIGIAAGAAVVLAALILLAFCYRRSKHKNKTHLPLHQSLNGGNVSQHNKFDKNDNISSAPGLDPRYDHDEVMAALNPAGGQPYLGGGVMYGRTPPSTSPHASHMLPSHSLPERPFEERPLPSRSDYYFVGDPRQSYISSQGGRPHSGATFATSPTSPDGSYTINSAGLPRPLSNQRLSTLSGSTAIQEPLVRPPSSSALGHLSSSSLPTPASLTAAAPTPMQEISPEGGYIKPPPSLGSQHTGVADPWMMASPTSPVTATVTDSLLFKNPQLYPDKDVSGGGGGGGGGYVVVPTSAGIAGAGVVYDPGMHPYQPTSGPLPPSTVFSPTMSNTASTVSSSTPLVGPPHLHSSPTSPYHDGIGGGGGGVGYTKVPLMAMVGKDPAMIHPGAGQVFQNPQLYADGVVLGGEGGQGIETLADSRRSSNPQGNNGYGAMLS
ncbi:hypothetical protein BGZ73_005906 [Actinomortierella ambigua]|nr:hypothetical protein BGZ73_005906 [Actinomortierella ambigua]